MLPELKSGDIILSSAQTWLSKAIRFFGKMHTGEAEYSHTAVAIGEGMLIEALWRIRINPVSKYENQMIEIWRLPLGEADRKSFRTEMMQLAGNDYGITKIPLFAADAVATQITRVFGRKKPVFWFTNKFGIFNIPVCSQLAVYGIHKFTSYRFRDLDHKEIPWRIVSPDYLQDLLYLPHNSAKIIHKQKVA